MAERDPRPDELTYLASVADAAASLTADHIERLRSVALLTATHYHEQSERRRARIVELEAELTHWREARRVAIEGGEILRAELTRLQTARTRCPTCAAIDAARRIGDPAP